MPLEWILGRASMEMVEMAEALDVQVSTLKMAEMMADLRDRQLFVRVDFLGFVSELSNGVSLSSYVSTHPVGFSAHLKVGNGQVKDTGKENGMLRLARAVRAAGERLSIAVHLLCEADDSR